MALLVVVMATKADDDEGRAKFPYEKPEGFFQYSNVPDEYSFEAGWNRGNPSHYIGRYEQLQGPSYRSKVNYRVKGVSRSAAIYRTHSSIGQVER